MSASLENSEDFSCSGICLGHCGRLDKTNNEVLDAEKISAVSEIFKIKRYR